MDFRNLLRSQWDRTAAVVATVLGGVFLLIGWIGVSGTPYLAEQIPYVVSGGIGGVFFLGLGATLWISADLRDEWTKLDRIEEALGDGSLRWSDSDGGPGSGPAGGAGSGAVRHEPPAPANAEWAAPRPPAEYVDQTTETPVVVHSVATAPEAEPATPRRRRTSAPAGTPVATEATGVGAAAAAPARRSTSRKAAEPASRSGRRAGGPALKARPSQGVAQ